MNITSIFSLWFLLFISGTVTAAPAVRDTTEITTATTGLTIVKGSIDLPRNGNWTARDIYGSHGNLTEIFLFKNRDQAAQDEGERSAKLKDRAAVKKRNYEIQRLYWVCRNFAKEGDGLAPDKLVGLEYYGDTIGEKEAAGFHFFSGVRMKEKVGDSMRDVKKSEPLLIDTTPAIDDGKHWVVDNLGEASRQTIDHPRMKALGLTIKPQAKSHLEKAGNRRTTVTYDIYARRTGAAKISTVSLLNHTTNATIDATWDTRDAAEADQSLEKTWAGIRLSYLGCSLFADASAFPHWATSLIDQYGIDNFYALRNNRENNRRRTPRSASAMGVIGGRAAIRETLQLQNISAGTDKNRIPSIPVTDIKGIEIKAHPFKEMLGDQPGGSLPLADWIPADHFFLYLPQPKKLFPLLDSSSGFLFQSGSTVTGRSGAYGIKDRYLESFGVPEKVMRRFLETGAIREIAATVPDLFFIDGTEISIVMKTGRPVLTRAALAIIGVPSGDGTTVKKNRHGEPVYWVRRDDILIISTHSKEVDAILAAKKEGAGLGQSHELRYMLTQVPLTAETVAYTYLSDPFIRKLVSPATKIGQLRRLHARADLEAAAAAALLAKFDGLDAAATDLDHLLTHKYLRRAHTATDRTLTPGFICKSETYGTPRRMSSLVRRPVELVSPAEQHAYGEYLTNYNRYWRRFFDPIAIRYEQQGDGQHTLETFILPLIENSLYNSISGKLTHLDEPLPVPVIEPAPVAMLSINLNDNAWLETIEEHSETITRTFGFNGEVLDYLGPDIHVALHDADPLATIGSGELAGLFGQFSGIDSTEMFQISTIISILTRPCSIHIGLSEPDEVKRVLTASSMTHLDTGRIFGFARGSMARVTGHDKWIYRISIEDIITMRLGIEVQGRYLVINNQPFSNQVKVTGSKPAANGAAALRLDPGACVHQAPTLYASAMEANRSAARTGAACLLPIILAGVDDIDMAGKQHMELFGFRPDHPGSGSWSWSADKSGIVSSTFGTLWANHQPPYDPEDTSISILRNVSHTDLSMQFEQDGLRTTVTWRTKK